MSTIAHLYQQAQTAGVPVPSSQALQPQYSRRNSSPDGTISHRRCHSHSVVHGYNTEYLFPERHSRSSEIRYLDPSSLSQRGPSPARSGTIRMPIVKGGESTYYGNCWTIPPTRNHFIPVPAPITDAERPCRSRRRYSYAAPGEGFSDSAYLAPQRSPQRSPSPCFSQSSRHSSRSSEKRVRFADGV